MRIQLVDLTKVHPGPVTALAGVSLEFERGLHGLLGPNGAGKTTLMKIACTLMEPTSGRILVDGRDLAEDRKSLRKRLGYLGQEWGAPRDARCGEIIDLVLGLRGVDDRKRRSSEIDRLLGLVGLGAHRKKKVKTLSGGMMRRLGVAQALAGEPELIVMDEPTVGLDPDERVHFRNLLTHLGRDRTIVLSTHIVADVGNTCGRVSVLAKGRLLFDGTPSDFVARARGRVFEVDVPHGAEPDVPPGSAIVSHVPTHSGARVRVVGGRPRGGVDVEPNLEDAYLLLVPDASAEVAAEHAAAS